jgi:hypothetical protein
MTRPFTRPMKRVVVVVSIAQTMRTEGKIMQLQDTIFIFAKPNVK